MSGRAPSLPLSELAPASRAGRARVVHTDELEWQPSPTPLVWRKRLELSGPVEAGRVTSIVRYDAGAVFPRHAHPDGEEILVLDGVFSDEHGRYPAGTFLLNPDGFEHAPFSPEGCTLFVKLRQMPGPRRRLQIDTRAEPWRSHRVGGVEWMELYAEPSFPERIHLTRVSPGVSVGPIAFPDGEEILVLSGTFTDENGAHPSGSWLLFPPGSSHTLSTATGCTLYVKQGHLSKASIA